jgi:hypothetical protein
MQEPELFGDQEQKDHHGAVGDEEVLSILPQAPGAQGNQVELEMSACAGLKRIGA